MDRQFSALVPAAALALAVLLPRWSAAQMMPQYDGPNPMPAQAGANTAAPSSQTSSAGQSHSAAFPRVTEMFAAPPPFARAAIRCPCRGGECGPRFYCCLGRRAYGYPYYEPSCPAVAQSYPSTCFPVLGIVYRSACVVPGPPLPDPATSIARQQGATGSVGAPVAPSRISPQTQNPPPRNTARLQLLVPEKAEVLIDDRKTTQAGTERQFLTPPLEPGKNFTYQLTVRYPGANGAMVEDRHAIRVRANDQLRMDFTPSASPSHLPTQEALSARK